MRGQGRARVSNIMYKEATSRDTLSHDIAQSYRVRLLAPEIETEDEEMIEKRTIVMPSNQLRNREISFVQKIFIKYLTKY